ncbi:putative ATPase inhibitor, mitochondrial [Schizosaccharomyces pombe]|uniref:Putative ATPase inhibitor, mitochondrial n=1 Tax=Schizosaccharomyces pombe (strain 972 / ATCC 24843) TaxID=284812 RepID=ATIF_SCHPO|nr:putative ATPase inhibitor [Schizosaccharomyces pombe]O74523.1 RecName: Full=Putative ATPase inhibitor, mitochondrial; AltName: Full=ATP synthase F1 subunit epsilon; Flags: Precursor [Schizosaccharomyces pombe 972h-]CAA19352.1 mitochondrial ATPase inhibitor (predicted) [Schizosaccharomyces pombe]|eukprot:NP_588536.1 putative ATPase inhibitor [Schizosaccharomyces pombe]
MYKYCFRKPACISYRGIRFMSKASDTDPTLANASSAKRSAFESREKAKEDFFVHQHEIEQLRKLKESLKLHREELDELESRVDKKMKSNE